MSNQLAVLNGLATDINREHLMAEEAARTAVTHALRAGELLIQAKAAVDHGAWLAWLRSNVSFSMRTAQGYMRLARELPALEPEKAQRVAELPLRQALQSFAKRKRSLSEYMTTEAFIGLADSIESDEDIVAVANIVDPKRHKKELPLIGTIAEVFEAQLFGMRQIGLIFSTSRNHDVPWDVAAVMLRWKLDAREGMLAKFASEELCSEWKEYTEECSIFDICDQFGLTRPDKDEMVEVVHPKMTIGKCANVSRRRSLPMTISASTLNRAG